MAAVIPSSLPSFTYTGTYETELRNDWGWVIRFKTSGMLKFEEDQKIDLHILGGGGGGGGAGSSHGSGGGGGYQVIKYSIKAASGTEYAIVVGGGGMGGNYDTGFNGAAGGASSAFNFTANGGAGGLFGQTNDTWAAGGAGGTGNGGARGWGGAANAVREFNGDASWPIYGGGGSGGGLPNGGGSPYGGHESQNARGYGGGGGGHAEGDDVYADNGGSGYQGIVCIRNSEILELPVNFDGTTLLKMFFNGAEVKHLIHNGTKMFMEGVRRCLDWSKPKTRSALPAR